PYQSVNYINSHDGFTLYDQVAYNRRHNWPNGEQNRDGHLDNNSWNCGWEGDEDVPDEVMDLRIRQAKNFFCLLMLSNGTPMLRAGDEFLQTQQGNNNPYNQDNVVSWLDWERLDAFSDFHRFARRMIAFRKAHPTIARSRFWRDDVRWYGTGPEVHWSEDSSHFAWFLSGRSQHDVDLYVMVNAEQTDRTFEIQERPEQLWELVIDTSRASPEDVADPGAEWPLTEPTYHVHSHSVVVLKSGSLARSTSE
ncbi:MAG: glycogen-debranching protein, partial [Planctomycetaceae bacterium]|nr:glycogen-debranching protein [Planctomycetaceae bacterium]